MEFPTFQSSIDILTIFYRPRKPRLSVNETLKTRLILNSTISPSLTSVPPHTPPYIRALPPSPVHTMEPSITYNTRRLSARSAMFARSVRRLADCVYSHLLPKQGNKGQLELVLASRLSGKRLAMSGCSNAK